MGSPNCLGRPRGIPYWCAKSSKHSVNTESEKLCPIPIFRLHVRIDELKEEKVKLLHLPQLVRQS